MSRCLVLYVLHEISPPVNFFLQHGVLKSSAIDYLFIINGDVPFPPTSYSLPSNMKIYRRENLGHDFGGWYDGIKSVDLNLYEYFLFLNSSVYGPFCPVWFTGNWVECFTQLLTRDTKLVGSNIGILDHQPHVQSMIFATDKVGIKILLEKRILDVQDLSKDQIIRQKEVRMSQEFLNAGYNIGCFLTAFSGIDFRRLKGKFLKDLNPFIGDQYFGLQHHPLETLFRKARVEGQEDELSHTYRYLTEGVSVPPLKLSEPAATDFIEEEVRFFT